LAGCSCGGITGRKVESHAPADSLVSSANNSCQSTPSRRTKQAN
jgi:hypothetical protein